MRKKLIMLIVVSVIGIHLTSGGPEKQITQAGEIFFGGFTETACQTISFPEFFLQTPLVFTTANHRENSNFEIQNDSVTDWVENISNGAFRSCVRETDGDDSHPFLFVHWLALGEQCDRRADSDGDGAHSCEDCDDFDPGNSPRRIEICDNKDNDCDLLVDEGFDEDNDGFTLCSLPIPDCDDRDPLKFPGRPEVCDNQDNDCDGIIDGFPTSCGVGECHATGTCIAGVDDCTPAGPTAEICDNLDNNCDGVTDSFSTSCGVGECHSTGTCTGSVNDCTAGSPVAEICDDGLDNDCDGLVDILDPTCQSINLVLFANPSTLVSIGTQIPESELSARVTNFIGEALQGQTVVFGTSEGVLNPEALTPINTDENGVARSILRTVQTATVTAFSGTATSTVTITVIPGSIQAILVNGDTTLLDCSLILRYTVKVLDTNGDPVPGVNVVFELRDVTGTKGSLGDWAGTFTPAQAITDSNGEVTGVRLIPDVNDCIDKCANSQSCSATVVVTDQTGLFESVPLIILDAVP